MEANEERKRENEYTFPVFLVNSHNFSNFNFPLLINNSQLHFSMGRCYNVNIFLRHII